MCRCGGIVNRAKNTIVSSNVTEIDEYKRILKLFEDNLRTTHNGKAT